jgi:hypothetical protein
MYRRSWSLSLSKEQILQTGADKIIARTGCRANNYSKFIIFAEFIMCLRNISLFGKKTMNYLPIVFSNSE